MSRFIAAQDCVVPVMSEAAEHVCAALNMRVLLVCDSMWALLQGTVLGRSRSGRAWAHLLRSAQERSLLQRRVRYVVGASNGRFDYDCARARGPC